MLNRWTRTLRQQDNRQVDDPPTSPGLTLEHILQNTEQPIHHPPPQTTTVVNNNSKQHHRHHGKHTHRTNSFSSLLDRFRPMNNTSSSSSSHKSNSHQSSSSSHSNPTIKNNPHQPEYYLKILVVGGPAVGKSSLLRRYCSGNWSDRMPYRATQGIDVHSIKLKQTKLMAQKFQMGIRVQFYDVPHSCLKNESHLTHALQDVHGILLLFDVTSVKSLQAVDQWRATLPAKLGTNVLLIAHKSDKSGHIIRPAGMDAYIRDCGYIGWHMTSAASENSVREAVNFLLDRILRQMYRKYKGLPLDRIRLMPTANNPNQKEYSTSPPNRRIPNVGTSYDTSTIPKSNASTPPNALGISDNESDISQSSSEDFFNQFYSIQSQTPDSEEAAPEYNDGIDVIQEEVEGNPLASVDVSRQQPQNATVDHPVTDLEAVANFYSEVKFFFDQIISRFQEYQDETESYSSDTKQGIVRSTIVIAQEEQTLMLDKITTLLLVLKKGGSDYERLVTKEDNLKRIFVELKREFYTGTVEQWSMLWYSFCCEAILGDKETMNGVANRGQDTELQHSLQHQQDRYLRKRNARTRNGAHIDDPSRIQDVISKTQIDQSQYSFDRVTAQFSKMEDEFPTLMKFKNQSDASLDDVDMTTPRSAHFRFSV